MTFRILKPMLTLFGLIAIVRTESEIDPMSTESKHSDPITLANYVATFLPEARGAEDAARRAAEQLSGLAAHFGTQAASFIRGADAVAACYPHSTRTERLIADAVDAARVAWQFARDAQIVLEWQNGGAR